MTVLVPPPPRISLVDQNGNITRPWSLYLQDVFERIGGAIAPSNDQLALMAASARGWTPIGDGEENEQTWPAPMTAPAVPGGPNTAVQYNSSGTFAGDALMIYDGAGTFGASNITGTALSLTLKPKTPTVLETAGTLFLNGQNAVKANTDGGAVAVTTGTGNGTGVAGDVSLGLGDGSSSLSMSTAGGLSFSGNASSTFAIDNNGGIFFTAGTSDGADISFVAGNNLAVTGNRPISLITDSGTQLSLTETTYGSPIAVLGLSSGKVGFYGTAGVTKAAAYTKTYSTASRTIPNATFSNLSTTAATNAVPWGFATQAQADAIATKVNQLGADVLILKQLIVSLVNDTSSALGVGLNAT